MRAHRKRLRAHGRSGDQTRASRVVRGAYGSNGIGLLCCRPTGSSLESASRQARLKVRDRRARNRLDSVNRCVRRWRMIELTKVPASELAQRREELKLRYEAYRARNLKLDMTRGKPGADQLDLSNDLLTNLKPGDTKASDGTDIRNYG